MKSMLNRSVRVGGRLKKGIAPDLAKVEFQAKVEA